MRILLTYWKINEKSFVIKSVLKKKVRFIDMEEVRKSFLYPKKWFDKWKGIVTDTTNITGSFHVNAYL